MTRHGKRGTGSLVQNNDKHPAASALQFSEAKLLAFPIRSRKGELRMG